ncbi:hypothetical protein DM02DRAFT_620817 [Periconia macrospinosa]|uniref:Uncharacterized protein n=1 Tax=Periconia macrospinosa TaxID=97972 RepID=A0A2V1CYQ4_9PLEO|nr:hypothetical protein DM02DRAFT_620817 [Periconia macrospinosa]
MPDIYDLPFPKNYVRMVASESDLYSAFFRDVIDFTSCGANLKPLLLRILVE